MFVLFIKSNDSKKSSHLSLMMTFWCCERFFGTSFAQIFFILNSWCNLKFNSYPIILTINPLPIFPSVLKNDCFPLRGSPSFWKSLKHLIIHRLNRPAEISLKFYLHCVQIWYKIVWHNVIRNWCHIFRTH